MKLKVTRTYENINKAFNDGYRMIVAWGGSRSGKSYSILQILITLLLTRNNLRITVWRNEKNTCRSTIMEDFKNILLSDVALHNSFHQNKSLSTFTNKKNGSKVSFEGGDNIDKVMGMTQDISFFNEITGFSKDVYLQITQRTSDLVFADYNPSKSFWLEKYRSKEDVKFVHSTYKDNAFVPENIVKQLESYNPNIKMNVINGTANNYLYQVYCLGLKAEKPNKIYKNWNKISYNDFKDLDYTSYYGLDFGEVSKTALVEVKFDGDDTFYIHQRLYKAENMMKSLVKEIDSLKLNKNSVLVCDSKSRDKIRDLQFSGYYALGAKKGSGSVLDGISFLSKMKVIYTEESTDLEQEYESYSWELDRYNKPTDEPLKKDDHLLDAFRYIAVFLKTYLLILR
jgi:phage terminase large subunit